MNKTVDILIKHVHDFKDSVETCDYYFFEPWDIVKPRPEWQIKMADEYGVDLLSEENIKIYGVKAPATFQSGIVYDNPRLQIIIAGNQTGKALPLDSIIYTKDGQKRVGDICVGDKVLGADGEEVVVLGVFPQGERDVYRLTFDDGATCECDIEHLWKYMPRKNASAMRWSHNKIENNPHHEKYVVESLDVLIGRVGIGCIKSNISPVFPVISKVDFNAESNVAIGAYAMGALLGDGYLGSGGIGYTCHDKDSEIVDRMNQELPDGCEIKRWPSSKCGYGGRGLLPYIEQLGLLGKKSDTKFIPEVYKYRSFNERLWLLRGLMDTDGCVSGRMNVEFYSKSEVLAKDVQWLVRSLGGKATIKTKKARYKKNGEYVDCGLCYRVIINIHNHNPFYLKRKADRFYNIAHRKERNLRQIEYVGKKPTQCITIDSEDGLFITDDFIVTHNSRARIQKIFARITGEYPYAMRFDKGVDTGIPRKIDKWNIKRFGRIDAVTKQVIDFDDIKGLAEYKQGCKEWNCGTIIGSGKFDNSLIAPEGAKCWIGTTQKAFTEMWKPSLWLEDKRCLIPPHFIDKKRGNYGYHSQDRLIYATRGVTISVITYETGAVGFEAANLFSVDFDEEPTKHEIFSASMTRCESVSVSTTPYLGITWLKGVMEYEPESKDPNYKRVYHCTQFDSPYRDEKKVLDDMGIHPEHEVPARVFGIPIAKAGGQPIFHPKKINLWMQRFRPKYELVKFSTKQRYGSVVPDADSILPSLMEVDVIAEKSDKDDQQFVWRMYEEVKKDEAYALIADPSEGDEIPENAGDAAGAIILRKPKKKDEWPQPVAIIRSTLLCEQFAEMTLHAARYYNNATLAPESYRRAAWNALYYSKTKKWPYWYYHETEKWSTRRRRSTPGFDTNAATRDLIFKKVQDWEDAFDENTQPNFVDDLLLIEMAGCIRGKKGRPDHITAGKLDLTVCFGIGLYILANYPEQFKCNTHAPIEEEESFLDRFRQNKTGDDPIWTQFRT